MLVKFASVHWNKRFGNRPRLRISLEGEDIKPIYKKVATKEGVLYWANSDGIITHLYHNPHNEWGHGGATFWLRMEDDSYDTVKGPWSSRAGVLNSLGLGPFASADYELNGVGWYGGTISLDIALKACQLCQCYLVCIVEDDSYEWGMYQNIDKGTEFSFCPSTHRNYLKKP